MTKTYSCLACGLHYFDKETSNKCRAFCEEFNGCSLEITTKSVEHQKYLKEKKS